MNRVVRVMAMTLVLLSPIMMAFQQQTRDTPPAVIAAGTAVIRGAVMSREASPRPIRRAIVTISGAIPGGQSVITGDDGRFMFGNLPDGRYTVTASKAAFVPTAYGATRPGRPGTPIVLTRDQQLDMTLTMARGGVVAGVVSDAQGHPLSDVRVGAVALATTTPVSELLASTEFVTTDDRGMYRIFGLMPGEYAIAATLRAQGAGAVGVRSASDMDALLAQLQLQRASGSRGAVVSAAPPAPMPAPPSYGYAPMYFPGTSQLRDAAHVTIALGEERTGLDFAVGPVTSAVIDGAVQGPVPDLAAVELTLVVNGPRVVGYSGMNPVLSGRPDASGHFKYTSVTPGSYTIIARGSMTTVAPGPAGRAGGAGSGVNGRGSGPPIDWLYGIADVDVGGQDVDSVSLLLVPGSVFSGRIVFDRTTETPPADLTKILIRITNPAASSYSSFGGTTIGNRFGAVMGVSPQPDGSVSVPGIAPGAYNIALQLPADVSKKWWLRSVIANDRDLLDTMMDARPGVDITNAVMTLSDRHTELAGSLTTPAGQPAPEYFVIVFPSDKTLWRPNARRVQSVRPGSDGTFSFHDLPPGEYLMVALTDVTANEWSDPKFLEQIAPAGVPITLGEGETKRQDLRIAR